MLLRGGMPRFKRLFKGRSITIPVDVDEVVAGFLSLRGTIPDDVVLTCFESVGSVKTEDDMAQLCDLISAQVGRPVSRKDVARKMMTLIELKKIDKELVDTRLLMNIVKSSV